MRSEVKRPVPGVPSRIARPANQQANTAQDEAQWVENDPELAEGAEEKLKGRYNCIPNAQKANRDLDGTKTSESDISGKCVTVGGDSTRVGLLADRTLPKTDGRP